MFIVNIDTRSHLGELNQRDSNLDLIFSNDSCYNLIRYRQEEDT